MRILQAHNFYRFRGGEDVVVEREANALEKSGAQVEKFYSHSNDRLTILDRFRTAIHLNGDIGIRERFFAKVEEVKPDILHVHNFFPHLSPAIFSWAKERKIPTFFTLHNFRLFCANGLMLRDGKACSLCIEEPGAHAVRFGCYQNSKIQSLPIAHMIKKSNQERIWWKFVDHFICSTEFTKRMYVKFGLPEERISVKSNFFPDPGRSDVPREEYSIYAGRISSEKGIRTLVSSWRPEFGKLKFCGKGPLVDWVRAAGFEVFENESQAEIFEHMKRAKILVLPTECYETGIPLIAMEAAALGTPMLLSKFGASEERFKDGWNAVMFPPGDSTELQACIGRLLADSRLRAQIGSNARSTYEKEFSDSGRGEELMNIYLRVKKELS